jgi:hypothetical protein
MDNQPLNWTQNAPSEPPTPSRSQKRRLVGIGAGLAAGGALVGAVLAGTLSAGAATPSTSPSGTSSTEAPDGHGGGGGGHALDLTGTVTAVGSSSLTIKTSTGSTVTYKVTSSSDIDKNGEAQLSSLATGDAVRYSVVSGTTTIDKLHAGDEAKDMPGMPGSAAG